MLCNTFYFLHIWLVYSSQLLLDVQYNELTFTLPIVQSSHNICSVVTMKTYDEIIKVIPLFLKKE